MATAGITAALALLIGLPTGSSPSRSLSVGFYLAGGVAIVVGFALGVRGPLRPGRADLRGFRWISRHEREDAISDSAVFVALGVALLVLGVLTDSRYPLL